MILEKPARDNLALWFGHEQNQYLFLPAREQDMDFKWNKPVAPVEPSLTPRELPEFLGTKQVLGQHGGATDTE